MRGRPKYQKPIEKHTDIMTAKIPISIMSDMVVFPLPNQQINANTGDNRVIPYHIII